MLSVCEAMITCCCISLCCEVTGPLPDPLPPTSPASAHLEVHSLLIHSSTRPQPDNRTVVPGPTSSNVRRISNDITNSSTCTAATVFLYSENVKTVKQHTHTHTESLWQGYKIHNETKCRMPNWLGTLWSVATWWDLGFESRPMRLGFRKGQLFKWGFSGCSMYVLQWVLAVSSRCCGLHVVKKNEQMGAPWK